MYVIICVINVFSAILRFYDFYMFMLLYVNTFIAYHIVCLYIEFYTSII